MNLFKKLLVKELLILNLAWVFLVACSSPAYDPENPDEYVLYWCDPEHRNQAIPPDHSWRNMEEYNSAEMSRQDCIDRYYLNKK